MDVEQGVKAVQEWLGKQPHLPQNIEEPFVRRFFYSARCSVERCKYLIELNYSLRSQAPEIFDDRDPRSPEVQRIFDAIDFCPLPKLTEKKHKVFIYRLADYDADKFLFADVLKVFFMVADERMHTDFERTEGEIPVFDMAGTTLKHLTKITLPLLKKYMTMTQEAHPVRIRQIHVINTASFLDKAMALVRPFLKGEVAQLLHFHATNSTTLYDYVPRDLLPEDYGGTLGLTMSTIKEEWRRRVTADADFFLDDSRWKIDESKRPDKNAVVAGNLFGMQGSFRSLTID